MKILQNKEQDALMLLNTVWIKYWPFYVLISFYYAETTISKLFRFFFEWKSRLLDFRTFGNPALNYIFSALFKACLEKILSFTWGNILWPKLLLEQWNIHLASVMDNFRVFWEGSSHWFFLSSCLLFLNDVSTLYGNVLS